MAETKIGLDQYNKPAPLWYRRLTNGMIIFIVPGLIGMIQGIPMSADHRNIWMMALGFFPALLKGIAMIIGNGQYYVPSNETIDKQNSGT
jgi:hypothetical protein